MLIGKTLSQYRILSKLGEGGMGEVYRAQDTTLGREVAIKLLPEALSEDPDRLARLEREARILAALDHPNIASVYGLQQVDGRLLLIMQLAEGETLAARIGRGALPVDEAQAIALQVAAALEAAHEGGIVHRDLKPGNVTVTDDGRVMVLDFGIAKAVEAGSAAADETLHAESPTLMAQTTEPGMILGTVAYMSPEQARGKPVDKRTDIWSFGCLLFEMLTGVNAFAGESAPDVLAAILQSEPPWERLPGELSGRVRDLLRKCLRKEPMDRLRDIGDARIELADQAAGERSSTVAAEASPEVAVERGRSSRGWLLGLLGAAVLGLAATAIWQLLPEETVVYLIDTTAPLGVYDETTRRAGGTNADDLTDALGDLPLTLVKENSSPSWHREHQVLMSRPDLVLVHLSAFAHQPRVDSFDDLGEALGQSEALGLEDPLALGRNKLHAFLGYLALGSPETRFLVYSRGTFKDEADRVRWVDEATTRFPELEGRLFVFDVPGVPGVATFRDPATAEQIEQSVKSILGLD